MNAKNCRERERERQTHTLHIKSRQVAGGKNDLVCLCLSFVMCGFCNVRVCLRMFGFLMCGFACMWIL